MTEVKDEDLVKDLIQGQVYAYNDIESYSDYLILKKVDDALLITNAWKNDDGTYRFIECSDIPKIQYMMVLPNIYNELNMESLHSTLLEVYEQYMDLSLPDPNNFYVFETDINIHQLNHPQIEQIKNYMSQFNTIDIAGKDINI